LQETGRGQWFQIRCISLVESEESGVD